MTLKIGYLNQDFYPEVGAGPARVAELGARWRAAGADVTVITGMPNRRMPGMEDGAIHPDYRRRLFMEEERDGLRVLRSWLYASERGGVRRTLLNNASFMVTGGLHGLLRARPLDVLVSSGPPFLSQVAGEAMRIVRRIPTVVEVRDLWPDYLLDMGILQPGGTTRAVFAIERWILRRADRVVVVTESFRRRVEAKGVDATRIHVIPNGVDLERYRRVAEPPPLDALRRRGPDDFVVGYLGNFGAGQELRTVVDAARILAGEGKAVRFVLVGDGKDKKRVLDHAHRMGVPGLEILPPLAKKQTPAFYSACDVCLVPLAPLPVFEETVPSKLFEIMACERPVVASVAGEAARVVEASGGGLVVAPGDAPAIAEAIRRLHAMNADGRAAMGSLGRAYVASHYDRTALADRYLQILQSTAKRERAQ